MSIIANFPSFFLKKKRKKKHVGGDIFSAFPIGKFVLTPVYTTGAVLRL